MMEGMNQTGQEEYIWAMRSTAYRSSDSDVWRERRSSPLTATSNVPKRRNRTKSVIPMTDDYHTKVLASLVPDEIIYFVNDYKHRQYEACLLFGDVSGFTDLCEKYNKTGKGGPSRLTNVLNAYIGAMVQEVLSHNGDVLKFSGDAFLAMWKSGPNDSMQDMIHEALDCAIMIQKSFGTYETDVGVILKVKLAISAGLVVFSTIGNQKTSHYVVVGQPIWDVKAAEHISHAGEIIVSPTAWHYVNPNEYLSEYMQDKAHVKVHGLGPNWRNTQKNIKYQKTDDIEDMEIDESKSNANIDDIDLKIEDEFSLRTSVNDAVRLNIKSDLRKFIIPPVMRGIEMDEPLEYLTEMRQIVIVFINVVTQKLEIHDFIRLVDQSYKYVCGVVDEMQGCVNKVSLFDKDLMFVVIFGLRGFKHEQESQIGLRCATECYQAISSIKHVKTCSIGVTTGMTYCGVVGHTLRREYTVISLIVNKAARLMVAYPDKVTCDRETFLHSKMEAKNFILQEHKELKGITNVGPIYEFKEQAVLQGMTHTVNPFPLLGREDEIKLYLRLLNECNDSFKKQQNKNKALAMMNHHNTLLISGVARQGKTRLLDEFVFRTPKTVPVNRFTVSSRDNKIPYQTIQLMFSIALGITELNSIKEKEEKLLIRLRKIKIPDLLCVLNNVFNVNFEKTDLYVSLNDYQRNVVLQKLMKQLCYGCFATLWVIAIDDGEFIDDESWSLLHILLDLDLILIVITVGTRKNLSAATSSVFNHPRTRHLELSSIDKWYHAGLACQILNVHAIPPELEKVIQSRSNGNPGWVESFLVSLMQAGGILIKSVDKTDVNELGLVEPPIEMMVRLTKEEIREIVLATSEEEDYEQDEAAKEDGWKMYQFSYRDSVLNLMKEKLQEKHCLNEGNFITVCTIAPNFNLEDVDPELTMDVMIMKTFDSLTSYEQLLLKCSAVLGESFPREMLLYIMTSTSPRATALAVQKLFEIRVLGCAQGDFTQGGIGMVFRPRLINPNQEAAIRCDCKGITIHESCHDLPKYASCGYLRFRLSMFRDTTYNLLTDSQKKEFHNRAIRYLEKETRRCRACGNGFFVRILGTRNDDGLKRREKKKSTDRRSSTRSSATSADLSGIISHFNEARHSTAGTGTQVRRNSRRETTTSLGSTDSRSSLTGSVHSNDILVPHNGCFGVQILRKLRYSNSLTRTFSAADFAGCQCPLILNTMYSQMLEHCKGAGRLDKMTDAMLEYAYICIVASNIPRAMKILLEAETLLKIKPISEEEAEEASWRIPLVKGKIQTLVGYSRLELGQVEEAYDCFEQALRYYGYPFPTRKPRMKLRTFFMEVKQRINFFLLPNMLIGKVEGYEAEFCDNLSECLSLMCNLFIDLQMWDHAEFTAAWSLNRSLRSDMDFYGMCVAYANMLHVLQHFGRTQLCVAMEIHALRLCHRKKANVEAQELKAVSKLYAAIFCGRLFRSEIDRAIAIGFVMLRISSTIHAIHLSLQVLPLLIQALVLNVKVAEAVTMLHELEYSAEEDTDNSGWTWYYALCVVLQLETGYSLETFKRCEKFYQLEGDTLITIRDPDAERRYYTVMWLWCIRNEDWEAATMWYTKSRDFNTVQEEDTISNIFTALYLLEGLILYLVGKMDKRNVRAIAHAYAEIQELIKILEKTTKIAKIILPRFYHLKAYFRFARNADSKTFSLLLKAQKYAQNLENDLELQWIEHSQKAWNNNLSAILVEFWREHCDPDNLMDYHEVDFNNGKLGLFTLPGPLYR